MDRPFPDNTDAWLLEDGPHNAIVVSSRARVARNLPRVSFASHANPDQLRHIADVVSDAVGRIDSVGLTRRLDLGQLNGEERCFLRESHLISPDLEKAASAGRLVFLSDGMNSSIMVNEEDHLRLTTLVSGLRIRDAYAHLVRIEEALEKVIDFAYSEEFGYLTACPSNTGTGLRLSVMLHLPALVRLGKHEEVLAPLGTYGIVVRGAYGEHSADTGDLFQISNEITLGKTEAQIMDLLDQIVFRIVEAEEAARGSLLRQRADLEDSVCRALGLLRSARSMPSTEAVDLLSKVRFGIGQDWGIGLNHAELSRLFVRIQPAHLQFCRQAGAHAESRDRARADLLREFFAPGAVPEQLN